jgi:hypothetical protein
MGAARGVGIAQAHNLLNKYGIFYLPHDTLLLPLKRGFLLLVVGERRGVINLFIGPHGVYILVAYVTVTAIQCDSDSSL